jgi:hypothetical protein
LEPESEKGMRGSVNVYQKFSRKGNPRASIFLT